MPGVFFMFVPSIIASISILAFIYFARKTLEKFGEVVTEFCGFTDNVLENLDQIVTELRYSSQENTRELQKEFNSELRELAEGFTRHSITLQKQHLDHLKELELKMISGGGEEYMDLVGMTGAGENSIGQREAEDLIDFTPHPFIPPDDLKDVKFGIEGKDGKVKVFEEKGKKKGGKKK